MTMALHMVDSNGGTDMFLVKIEHEGTLHAHAIGTLSDVVERIADNAYQVESGESGDHFEVWHLSYGLPMLVKLETVTHYPIGYVEVVFTWDQGNPHTRRVTSRRESGYYRLPGA